MTKPQANPARVTPQVFVLGDSEAFRNSLATELGAELAPTEERTFEDAEHKLRPLVDVRHRDVYVVYRLAGDGSHSVNDKLMRLLFFLATLRDAGAQRVTAVLPYLPYARKDRRTKPRDPVTMRYLAQLLEAAGVERVAALEVHNVAAFENAFRCETVHLEAHRAFAEVLADLAGERPIAVISPDTGGVKRADAFRATLERITGRPANPVFMEKHRSDGVVSGTAVVGSLKGCLAVIVDDLIAGGTTMRRAVDACRASGAETVVAAATHGVFAPGAEDLLSASGPDRLLITNSVDSPVLARPTDRLVVRPVEPLVASTIRNLTRNA
ncbi:ribose-phosphate diphosphokinase [Aquisalimonas sp.]|uniref:ribose-phosphate diphosphokinase n=1 Tax=Aquisalimonas sp. TaxID=1872621 RepID=UPI0025B94C40|nr:ribose-phosphate diphosphokinase [Aquisalimonas sp.]